MEAKGFKSFANKTEFIFSDKFNCIIGPNGSGKSNVLDALCFVLGRTSVKSMRADKSASLIYNGGKTKEPAKDGMVQITFSNDDHTFPIEAPTVTITRMVKHDGTGVYKINDKKVTRQEIHELLMNARIDPEGHNIILQGDIIHMIDMSDVERRQVIEDVSGIGVYEERKEKTMKELEKVALRLNDTELILTEREARIKELKVERDQAIKYKEIVDKINTNKALKVRAQVRERTKKIEDATKGVTELNSKIDELKTLNDNLLKKIEEENREIAKINTDIEQKGEKEQIDLQKTIERLKIEFATNQGKIESCQNEINRIVKRREELNVDMGSVRLKISDFESNKKILVESKTRLDRNIIELEEKIIKFKDKNKIEDTQKIDAEIDALDKAIEEDSKKIEELRVTQQNLFREKDQAEYKLQSIDEQMFKLKEVSKESESQIEELKDKQNQFKKVTLDLSKLLAEDSSISAQVANARSKLDFSQGELTKLEAKQQAALFTMSGNNATREILDQKKNDTIKGIIGLVSELGNVKKEFTFCCT
jgi:chromosome segregation protein